MLKPWLVILLLSVPTQAMPKGDFDTAALNTPSVFSLKTIIPMNHLKWLVVASMVAIYWHNPLWMDSVSLYASDLSRGILHAPDHLTIKGFVLLGLNAGFAAREIWNLRHRRAA